MEQRCLQASWRAGAWEKTALHTLAKMSMEAYPPNFYSETATTTSDKTVLSGDPYSGNLRILGGCRRY